MSYYSLFYSYKDQSPWTDSGAANLSFPLVVAMSEMGISGTQIRTLIGKYLEKNPVSELVQSSETVTKENWTEHIGKRESYSTMVRFFETLINEEPENIRLYFAKLEDGIFSNHFYPLIRLAYALESGQKDEVARALAFLAASYQPLAFELPSRETKVFIEQILNLAENKEKYGVPSGNLDADIRQISESKRYLEDFAKLEEENLNIFTLRALAIRLCREVDEDIMKTLFCAVHAFRVISTLLTDTEASIQQFYMVMQALYLAIGCPEMKPAEEGVEKNWPLIFQLSGVSRNHTHIFFMYSCYREYQFAPSTIYPEMAYRVIQNEIKLER